MSRRTCAIRKVIRDSGLRESDPYLFREITWLCNESEELASHRQCTALLRQVMEWIHEYDDKGIHENWDWWDLESAVKTRLKRVERFDTPHFRDYRELK